MANMADAGKKEKLAAARKKLKQFQQKKTGKTPNNSPASNPVKKTAATHQSECATLNGPGSPKLNGPVSINDQGDHGTPNNSIPNKVKASPSPQTTQTNHSPNRPVSDQSMYKSPSTTNTPTSQRLTESTERLQQLSRQINGLITESTAYLNGDEEEGATGVTDLETRNRELASLVERNSQANENMAQQVLDLKKANSRLQQQLDTEKKGFEEKIKRDLGALKEQLQVHIQTIGILVAEKTELQSALTQGQKAAEQRMEELEELSGRLKASRQRVAELERNFSTASSSNQKHEQSSKEMSKDVDRLKMEVYKLGKSNEEWQQQNSELQEKLQKKVSECSQIENTVIELKGKLEMAELYNQQLQNQGEDAETRSQIDQLLSEKGELQAKVDQYMEALQKVGAERDQIVEQYQQYIQQLTQQNQELQTQISQLTEEKDQLTGSVKELEAIIEDLQTRQNASSESKSALELSKQQQEEMSEALHKVQADYEQLTQRYQAQFADNAQLSMLVEEKEAKILELESSMSRLGEDSIDKEQLLESMQGDKMALSRALAQNKELKSQLAELQNGFVKMTNDNMDLLTQVSSEQHISKELAARLSQQEDELKDIREQLVQKERQLEELQDTTHILNKNMYTNEQLADRLRHFEAQAQLVETLQRELTNAQDAINALTNQNSELRETMLKTQEDLVTNGNLDGEKRDEVMESMSASVRQLEMERNEILEQLREEQKTRQDLHNKLKEQTDAQTPALLNGDVISKAQFDGLREAMEMLETKYTKAMRDKADLKDLNEQMEHSIMQLQGETDTIGEYITLYQTQRSILRQRQVEKDDYIARLAREREDLQEKLGQLQALVMQLLGERQMLHSYQDNNNKNITMATEEANPGAKVDHKHSRAPGDKDNKPFGALHNSQLEDWPDYTSSDTDSDTSEVEAIIGEGQSPKLGHQRGQIDNDKFHKDQGNEEEPRQENIPEDHTAQKIMHLLTELGTSNIVDRTSFTEACIMPCPHCSGRIQIL